MDLESKYNAAVAALALMREQRDQALDQYAELRALVSDWAHNQYVPKDHTQGKSLLPWLKRCGDLNDQLMRAGGVEPRKESNTPEGL